jgi:predicted MPP superfamily phosphohydrolase
LLLCVSLPLGALFTRRLPAAWRGIVAAVLYSWLGLSFLLLTVLIAIDLARAALAAVAWWRGQAPPADPSRRLLLRRAVALGGGGVASGLALAGVYGARGEIAAPERPIRLARLPRALDGLTLVQISDLHVGLTIGRRFVESVVERANALHGDAIVVTGDLVDGSPRDLADRVAPLHRLAARYGVFFVPGNHDHYSGLGRWLPVLQGLGWRTLVNERVELGDAGARLDLAGIDDYRGRPDLARALAGRDPERELVLLAHQPRAVFEAARADCGLVLSGHTHGGQIWPFGAVVRLSQPYVAGLHRHGERTQIYVSCGTGYWGPPMRIGAPAEITKLVLLAG